VDSGVSGVGGFLVYSYEIQELIVARDKSYPQVKIQGISCG